MVDVHRIICDNVNCYIVADKGKAILIDTGRKKSGWNGKVFGTI